MAIKISNLPASPGRDLLMRLEYVDNQLGDSALAGQFYQARDSTGYYVALLASYVVEKCGDSNSDISIAQVNEFFSRKREEVTSTKSN